MIGRLLQRQNPAQCAGFGNSSKCGAARILAESLLFLDPPPIAWHYLVVEASQYGVTP